MGKVSFEGSAMKKEKKRKKEIELKNLKKQNGIKESENQSTNQLTSPKAPFI